MTCNEDYRLQVNARCHFPMSVGIYPTWNPHAALHPCRIAPSTSCHQPSPACANCFRQTFFQPGQHESTIGDANGSSDSGRAGSLLVLNASLGRDLTNPARPRAGRGALFMPDWA